MAERPDSFELVETVEGLEALRPDWERLLALNPAHVQAQTPDWCLAAWRHVAAPRGARLATVVGRRDGAVDLIWPLVAQRRMLWPVLRPLDAQAADYCDVLCLPDPMAPARVAGAIAFARRRAAASVLSLPYARMDGQLGPVAACLWPRRTEHRFSRIARTGDGGDWESFARSLSRSQRRKVQQRRRRLEALGTLAAGPVEDADAVADAFDWLASTKSAWLGQRGLPNLWIRPEGPSGRHQSHPVPDVSRGAARCAWESALIGIGGVEVAARLLLGKGIGKAVGAVCGDERLLDDDVLGARSLETEDVPCVDDLVVRPLDVKGMQYRGLAGDPDGRAEHHPLAMVAAAGPGPATADEIAAFHRLRCPEGSIGRGNADRVVLRPKILADARVKKADLPIVDADQAQAPGARRAALRQFHRDAEQHLRRMLVAAPDRRLGNAVEPGLDEGVEVFLLRPKSMSPGFTK